MRAFQGVGGGGCFALATIILIESVPPPKYAKFVAYIGIALILAMVLGPIIGGGISENTTWRWIFLFKSVILSILRSLHMFSDINTSVPIGVLIFVMATIGIPNGFPYHGRPEDGLSIKPTSSTKTFQRLDIPGSILLMMSTLAFTACFQEADSRFAWNSAFVITLLVATAVLWGGLMLWERHVTLRSEAREPVLPWRFFINPAMVGILLGFVFLGGPMTVVNFQLPQRFQLVNGLSGLDAGIRLLPFGAAVPVGTVAGANAASKLRVPAIYLVMIGAIFQIIGYSLLSTLGNSLSIEPALYGYQVLVGVGSGMSYQVLYLLVPFTSDKIDNGMF